MAVCFLMNWGEAETDAAQLVQGLAIPWMKPYMLTQAVATIGAVIMPHNLYLHSGLVRSRDVDRSRPCHAEHPSSFSHRSDALFRDARAVRSSKARHARDALVRKVPVCRERERERARVSDAGGKCTKPSGTT